MEDKEKIIQQRDKIDDKNTEIQRLHDRMELIDENDIQNVVEHKQLFEQNQRQEELMKNIDYKLEPILETYKTVGRMTKWLIAFLVFLSLVGGVILTWKGVIESYFKK